MVRRAALIPLALHPLNELYFEADKVTGASKNSKFQTKRGASKKW